MKKWLFVFLFVPQVVAFSQSAGKVLFTSKQVTAERDHQQRTLSRGSEFYEGDTIRTSAGALAQLQYSNGTLIALQPNSDYSVTSYNKSSKSENSAYLSRGGLDSSTSEKKKSILNTPLVALAIAGTQYRAGILCNVKHCKNRAEKSCKAEHCKKIAIQVTKGKVIVDGRYALGPNEKYSSAIYDANTHQITYGPINWSANGWIDFSLGNNPQDFIDPTTLTQVINSTTVAAAASIMSTTLLPFPGC